MPSTPPDTPDYQMFPRVVPEGWQGKLRISGDYTHARLKQDAKYDYALRSVRWYADTKRKREPLRGTVRLDAKGGFTIPFTADVPGEWILEVASEDKRVRRLPVLGLYVLNSSLHGLRPYIGDLHAHSTGSDGRQEPAYVAIRARSHGYDFFALTDHNNFASSGEMLRKAHGKLGGKMLLLRGEELHAPNCSFHYVSIGHKKSIENMRTSKKAAQEAEVLEIVKELKGRPTVPHLNLKTYAEGLWKIRKARQSGGLVLFAHPYWSYQNTLCLDESEREQAFLDHEFDAVEVTTTADCSFLMSNRLAQASGEGRPLSAVGISDSHNWAHDGTSGKNWTFVMASALTQEAIFEAIRVNRSLACEDIDGRIRLAGSFDLVDFADFYHRRLLPIKRRVMALEAELAFSALRGGPSDGKILAGLDRELTRIETKLWG